MIVKHDSSTLQKTNGGFHTQKKIKQPNAAAVRIWPGRRRSSRLPSGTHPRASRKSWSCPAGKSSPSWAMTHGLETMFGGLKMKQQKQQDQAIPGFINQHVCLNNIYICLCTVCIYIYIYTYIIFTYHFICVNNYI